MHKDQRGFGSHARLETIPVMTYKSDCWKKRPVSAALLQKPGAGINAFKPFETVEKDGYFPTACVQDFMYAHGDKFGDNRHEYTLGAVSNVSIVHYEAHVPKEDRKEMTQKVCFEFCRTVPEMLFFGIVNGRNCYCAPYFKPMAGDSSHCDATCEGAPGAMCGGKTRRRKARKWRKPCKTLVTLVRSSLAAMAILA